MDSSCFNYDKGIEQMEAITAIGSNNLLLCGKDGVPYGRVRGIDEAADKPSELGEASFRLEELYDCADWGRVPGRYSEHIGEYPAEYAFSLATIIPRNRILEEYSILVNNSDPAANWWRCTCLIKYYEVFPHQDWITKAMYQRLKQIDEALPPSMIK